jgi:hypothetical protein
VLGLRLCGRVIVFVIVAHGVLVKPTENSQGLFAQPRKGLKGSVIYLSL